MSRRFRPLRGIGAVVREKRRAKQREDKEAARMAMIKLLASHGGRHRGVIMTDDGAFRSGYRAYCDLKTNFGSIPKGTYVSREDYRDFIEDLRFRR